MGGVDTVRGINYQHCHAILAALEVAGDPSLAGIRVEGTEDVLDLEIHALPGNGQGTQTVVVRGLQIKSRMRPYTWAKSELLAIIRRWAGRPVSATSELTLRTDGELSPTGLAVAQALDSARDGNLQPIASLLGISTNDALCAVAARATIVSEPGTVEALLLAAEREVRAMLPRNPLHPDAERESADRINELFVLISVRSGQPDPDERMISREELLDLLGGVAQLSSADRWATGLAREYAGVAAAEDVSGIVLPSLREFWTNERFTVGELGNTHGPIVLAGRTGSGKSTAARLWRVIGGSANKPVVICHAEMYLPRGLDRLVADSVGNVVGRYLPRVLGTQVLGDAESTVVIDGASEIPSQVLLELAKDLRSQLADVHGARIALVGRDEAVCASALPPTRAAVRLRPESFGHAARLELTAKVLAGSRIRSDSERPEAYDPSRGPDATPDTSASDHQSRVALAQAEHGLGDAAGNPMLLRLALELIAGGVEFTDRASLYALTIDRMAARANAADIRIATAALGIVFSRLLDDGRRYANPLEWERLFKDAEEALKGHGVVADPGGVRDAVARSGIVNAVVTGIGQTQLRVPVHDSFADYFAARAHADDLVSLPRVLVENDENRLLLSAQMRMLSEPECLQVAAQVPFSLVRISESDHRQIDEGAPRFVSALLSQVLPGDEPTAITMWHDKDHYIARIGGMKNGWVIASSIPSLYSAPTVVAEPTDGPVAIAVRLWRLVLKQRLRQTPRVRPDSPRSLEEACDQLAAHSQETVTAGGHLLAKVAPTATGARLARTIGPYGMTGLVYQRQTRGVRADVWPVRYRHTPETSIRAVPDDEPLTREPGDGCTCSTDVESVLSTSPEQAAAERISKAINALTRNNWL